MSGLSGQIWRDLRIGPIEIMESGNERKHVRNEKYPKELASVNMGV